MGLTKLKAVQLENAGLNDLFDKHKSRWRAMAKRALKYATQYVDEGEIRPDDLIPYLVPPLELDDILRNYIAKKRLAQKYWYTNVGELIVDRVWDEI